MTDSGSDPTTESKVFISDDDLVSYLDGELLGETRDQLEQRLVDDDALRNRLRQLQTSWDMLQHLPDPPPSRDLVESTMEMAVIDVTRSLPSYDTEVDHVRPGPLNRLLASGVVGYLAMFIGLGLIGGLAGIVKSRFDHNREADGIRLAADLDALLYAKDLDFMRWLSQSDGWNEWVRVSQRDAADTPSPNQTTTLLWSKIPIDQALRKMSVAKRSQIQSSLSRLQQMSPQAVQRVDAVAMNLSLQTDRDELMNTMRNFAKFREGLNSKNRDALETALDAEAKQVAFQEALNAAIKTQTRRSGDLLDEETVDAIYESLTDILDQRQRNGDVIVREMKRTMKRLTSRGNSDLPILWRLFGDRSPQQRREGGPAFLSKLSNRASLTNAELNQVFGNLPIASRERLETMAGQNELLGNQILVYWIEESIRRKAIRQSPRGQMDAKQRYAKLPEGVRDEIDLLPPDEFLRILTENREPGRGSARVQGRGSGRDPKRKR